MRRSSSSNARPASRHPTLATPEKFVIPWRYGLLGPFTSEVQRRSDDIIHRLTRGSRLYGNDGDGTFTDVAWVNAADQIEDGRGLSIFDDRDGRLDLVARTYRQPAVLLHDEGPPRQRLELQIVDTRSNRDAVPARPRLQTAAGWQTREVHAGSAYLSGQSLVQHFGLGDATRADTLEIRGHGRCSLPRRRPALRRRRGRERGHRESLRLARNAAWYAARLSRRSPSNCS